jgi:alkylation response protein AidB-like acyl-CoA dehydrogenase
MLRNVAKEFAEREIAPKVSWMDNNNETPLDVVKKMGELGFGGVLVPDKYGGAAPGRFGMGHLARIIMLEEIAAVSPAFANMLQVHALGQSPVLYFGTEAQKEKFLKPTADLGKIFGLAVTESVGGSDVLAGRTTARKEGDVWILNGDKAYITNASTSGFHGVTAITGERGGTPRLSCFILERGMKGFRTGTIEDEIGMSGCGTGELLMEDVEVPEENLIGRPGMGMRIALTCIANVGRPGVGACGLGICRAALHDGVRFASERKAYGEPIANLQMIQNHIAKMAVNYHTARWIAYQAAWTRDQAVGRPDHENAMCKLVPTEGAVDSTRRLIYIYGALGCDKGTLAERLYRDAIVTISAAGTAEILKLVIAGDALGGNIPREYLGPKL